MLRLLLVVYLGAVHGPSTNSFSLTLATAIPKQKSPSSCPLYLGLGLQPTLCGSNKQVTDPTVEPLLPLCVLHLLFFAESEHTSALCFVVWICKILARGWPYNFEMVYYS